MNYQNSLLVSYVILGKSNYIHLPVFIKQENIRRNVNENAKEILNLLRNNSCAESVLRPNPTQATEVSNSVNTPLMFVRYSTQW